MSKLTNSVNKLPETAGVYAIRLNNEIVYIGSSKNPRSRMRNHIAGMENRTNTPSLNGLWKEHKDDLSVVMIYEGEDYRKVEKEQIEAYNPSCNVVGSTSEYDGEKISNGKVRKLIDIDDDLYEKIKLSAKQNRRTISGELLYSMERGMRIGHQQEELLRLAMQGEVSRVVFSPEISKEQVKEIKNQKPGDWSFLKDYSGDTGQDEYVDNSVDKYDEVISKIENTLDRDVDYEEKQELMKLVKDAGLVYNSYKRTLEKRDPNGRYKIIKEFK